MKEHKGMRPQDVVILLKISCFGHSEWLNKDIGSQLYVSNSEVSESLNRSRLGGLVEEDKQTLRKESLIDFLVYGLRHVFPAIPGPLMRGMPTAYSAPVLNDDFVVDDPYIWPAKGNLVKGITIQPLYKTVPKACKKDKQLYELLALVDALRVGNREQVIVERLAKRIYGSDSPG